MVRAHTGTRDHQVRRCAQRVGGGPAETRGCRRVLRPSRRDRPAARRDRHAAIGEGEIGEEAFRLLVNDKRFENIPILLETPMENEGHERDLAKLKSF